MKFVLDASLFVAPRTLALLRLFGFALEGRHRIEIRDRADAAFHQWVKLLKQCPGEVDDAVVAALDLASREEANHPSGVELFVSDREASAWSRSEINLDDALLVAGQAFYVLLENAETDSRFLRAMMTSDERSWFDERIKREWLIFAGCGGITELTKRVKALNTGQSSLGLRSAALFDSDAVEAGKPHANSRAAKDACERVPELPHHQLARRSIENYLPPSALERLLNKKDEKKKASALGKLLTKHFYNAKDGHRGDRKRTPIVPWLPAKRNTPLEEGFGDDVGVLFESVGNHELVADGGFAELRAFIERLQRRIQ